MKFKFLHIALLSLFSLYGSVAFGQLPWKLVDKLPIEEVVNTDYDRVGNLYWSESSGKITKVIKDQVFQVYWPEQSGEALLDAWRSLDVFAFYPDYQLCRWLNQRMGLEREHIVQHDAISYAAYVAPASDNQLWIWDQEQFMLKKYHLGLQQVSTEVRLDVSSITLMKEYQNNLYILDETNTLTVLDLWGNVMRTFPVKGSGPIHFYENFIYQVHQGETHWIALYDSRKQAPPINFLPKHQDLEDVLWNGEYLYVFLNRELLIYQSTVKH